MKAASDVKSKLLFENRFLLIGKAEQNLLIAQNIIHLWVNKYNGEYIFINIFSNKHN